MQILSVNDGQIIPIENHFEFRIPITFELEDNESPTIYNLRIKSICLGNDEILEHEAPSNLIPIDSISKLDTKPINYPVNLKQITENVNELVVCFQTDTTLYDWYEQTKKEGVLKFGILFRRSIEILFRAKIYIDSGMNKLRIVNIEREKNPLLMRLNFALLFSLMAYSFTWNLYFNKDVYNQTSFDSSIIDKVWFFALGFFGLQILNVIGWLKTISGVQSLWSYPEIYLNSAMINLLKRKTTTLLISILFFTFLHLAYKNTSAELAIDNLDLQKIVLVDANHKVINNKRIYLKTLEKGVYGLLSDRTIENNTPVLKIVPLKNTRFYWVFPGLINLRADYRNIKLIPEQEFNNGLKQLPKISVKELIDDQTDYNWHESIKKNLLGDIIYFEEKRKLYFTLQEKGLPKSKQLGDIIINVSKKKYYGFFEISNLFDDTKNFTTQSIPDFPWEAKAINLIVKDNIFDDNKSLRKQDFFKFFSTILTDTGKTNTPDRKLKLLKLTTLYKFYKISKSEALSREDCSKLFEMLKKEFNSNKNIGWSPRFYYYWLFLEISTFDHCSPLADNIRDFIFEETKRQGPKDRNFIWLGFSEKKIFSGVEECSNQVSASLRNKAKEFSIIFRKDYSNLTKRNEKVSEYFNSIGPLKEDEKEMEVLFLLIAD